jgi:hypothetical protein
MLPELTLPVVWQSTGLGKSQVGPEGSYPDVDTIGQVGTQQKQDSEINHFEMIPKAQAGDQGKRKVGFCRNVVFDRGLVSRQVFVGTM